MRCPLSPDPRGVDRQGHVELYLKEEGAPIRAAVAVKKHHHLGLLGPNYDTELTGSAVT